MAAARACSSSPTRSVLKSCGDAAEPPRIRAMLPGQQRHDDQRAEQHGDEGRSGVFQFEADDTHESDVRRRPRPWSPLIPGLVLAGHTYPRPERPSHTRIPCKCAGLSATCFTRIGCEMLNSLELTGRAATHVRAVPQLAAHAASRGGGRGAGAARGRARATASISRSSRASGISRARRPSGTPSIAASGRCSTATKRRSMRRRWMSGARVDAILLWSALPGASRHHWGRTSTSSTGPRSPPDYRPQLIAKEFAPAGPFSALERLAGGEPAALRILPALHARSRRRAARALAPELRAGRRCRRWRR